MVNIRVDAMTRRSYDLEMVLEKQPSFLHQTLVDRLVGIKVEQHQQLLSYLDNLR